MKQIQKLEYSEKEIYLFKIRDEFFLGLNMMIGDHVREQNENIKTWTAAGSLKYKYHNFLGNRARRRMDKREDFSIKA